MNEPTKTAAYVAKEMSAQAPFLAWAVLVATGVLAWLLYDSHVQTDKLVHIQIQSIQDSEKRTQAILELAKMNQELTKEIRDLNDITSAQVEAVISRLDAGRQVMEKLSASVARVSADRQYDRRQK